MFRICSVLFLMLIVSFKTISQQAQLIIDNRTIARLYVKIMEGTTRKAQLFEQCNLEPKSKQDISIPRTGSYFLKIQLVYSIKNNVCDTMYIKSPQFYIVSDPQKGYSQITYRLKMSRRSKLPGSTVIGREEFWSDE